MPIHKSEAHSRRQKALQWGHVAEWLAMFAMILKGYRPLARRYQGWGGEIDLIMRRGKTILFIEVKARIDPDSALLAIHADKIRKINQAIQHWLMRHDWAHSLTLRGDAVLVSPWHWPHHVKDAFTLEL
jgi:putative endonuclease